MRQKPLITLSVLVAEKRLDDAGVDLVLEEPGRIGVTQRVWRRVATAGEIGRLDGLGKGAGQDMGGDGTGSPAIGEETARIAVVLGLPHPPQAFVHLLGHGHDPFLVALADDAQDATGLVDGGDGKSSGLTDPQAAAVNGPRRECAALRYGKASAAAASAWEAGSFFKQRPVLAQRVPVEELDAVMAGLEAAARVPLTNIQQISADLFLGQQLRRPIVMLRQRPDRLEVNLLGRGCQARP